MAFTKVVGPGIHTLAQLRTHNIHSAGIITATRFDGSFTGGSGKDVIAGVGTFTELDVNGNADFSGNVTIGGSFTVQGDTTTLNTTLRNVELLRVSAASTLPAGIITQTGTGDILRLYDTNAQIVTVADGGNVTLKSTNPVVNIQGTNASSTAESNLNFLLRDGNSADRTVAKVTARNTGNGGYGALDFYTAFNNTNTKRMTINNDGTVGISTSVNLGDAKLSAEGVTALTNTDQTIMVRDSNSDDAIGRGGNIGFGGYVNDTMRTLGGIGAIKQNGGTSFNGALTLYTRRNGQANLDERVRITSDGNVGIGTVSPGGDLHIWDDDSSARLYLTSGNSDDSSIYFGRANDTATAAIRNDHSDDSLRFYGYNNSERIRISSTGLVGIGMTIPRSKLDIFETVTGNQTAIRIGNANTPPSANDRRIEFVDGKGTTEGTNKFTYAYIQGIRASGANNGDLIFGTKPDNASAPSERLRIHSDGKVSIGSTVSGGWKLRVQVPANSSYQSALNITNNVNADINFEIKNSESSIGPSTNTPLVFKTNNTEKLRITGSGRIGIADGGATALSNRIEIVEDPKGWPDDSAQPQAIVLIKSGTSGSNRRWVGIGASLTGAWLQSSSPGGSGLAAPFSFNPGGGDIWINKKTTSDKGRLQVKGGSSGNIITSDIRSRTLATFGGSDPGSTDKGHGSGIVIKPIADRGTNWFFGAANAGTNKEGSGIFVIRHGSAIDSTNEKLRIDGSSGNVAIGTTVHTSELTVRGGGTVSAFEGTGGNGAIMLTDVDNGKNLFLQNADGVFNIQTSGSSYSTKVAVKENGQVNIPSSANSSGLELNPGSGAGSLVFDRNGHITSFIRASDGKSNVGGGSGGGSRIDLNKTKIILSTFPYVTNVGDTVSYNEVARFARPNGAYSTLSINGYATNGNTYIGDNYGEDGAESTICMGGNMYSGAGYMVGYGCKPKTDSWGFISTQDSYADRKVAFTLNGGGYNAVQYQSHNAASTVATNAEIADMNKIFCVAHSGVASFGNTDPDPAFGLRLETGGVYANQYHAHTRVFHSGYFALADGAEKELVYNASGYGRGFIRAYFLSYHGSIGRGHFHGSISKYCRPCDSYTNSNSMGHTSISFYQGGSHSGSSNNHNGIKLTRSGTYGNVGYRVWIETYAPGGAADWKVGDSSPVMTLVSAGV